MTGLILALDQGTTSTRALVFDADRRVIASAQQEFPQHYPHPGWVEHDAEDIWRDTLACAKLALERGGLSAADIAAIGVTNQRETTVLWDRNTGKPLHNAIVWQDRRTAEVCAVLRDAGHEPLVQERTGLLLDPYFSATKLAWLLDTVPGARAAAEAGELAFGTIDTFLLWRLTEGRSHRTDVTNASRTLLYDITTGAWSPELADLLGVPLDCLPEIVPSYGVVGMTDPASFLGISAPISGIAGDQQAALVGQAGFAPGAAKCTYGTGSFLLMHTGSSIARSSRGLLTTVALGHPGGRLDYALEGAVFVTGAAVQWLRDGLGIIDRADQVEALAASVPDSGGVVFVPALTGLGAPVWDPHARGLVIGITRSTTSAHLARATLEAIAYSVAEVVDAMALEGGVGIGRLAVDGGAAANSLLCQLQADIAGVVVDRAAQIQTTGLGAAFLAGLGVGIWPSTDALATTRASAGVFEPGLADPSGRARWRSAVERSRGWANLDG